jgi:hypothetical protein
MSLAIQVILIRGNNPDRINLGETVRRITCRWNRIGGVVATVLDVSVVDCWFESQSFQTKDY